jgi:hypothetical protein
MQALEISSAFSLADRTGEKFIPMRGAISGNPEASRFKILLDEPGNMLLCNVK